jgi:hypothetical protein
MRVQDTRHAPDLGLIPV